MVVTARAGDPPTLIEAFIAGNELALAEIYGRWSPLVYNIALGSLGSVADAEEVTQRVFTGAWTSRQTFDASRGELSGWLIGITLAKITEAQTARNRQAQPLTQMTPVTHIDDTIKPADLAEGLLLVDQMSRLDVVPQKVLRMALNGHLTHAQIAERTGLPPATVTSVIRRTLLELRKRLEVLTGAY